MQGEGHDQDAQFRRRALHRGFFCVGYLLTGSVVVGGALALVEPAINTVAYYFHEKAWQRVGRWA
jgi:uncharacterized membrane protein